METLNTKHKTLKKKEIEKTQKQGAAFSHLSLLSLELRILCFCGAMFVLFILAISSFAHAAEWQQPIAGLHYAKLRVERPDQDIFLEVFRVDLHKLVLKPLWSTTRKTVQQFAEEQGALLVINANFFDGQFHPLGLVQARGQTLNPFKKISWWSIFCLKDQKASIIHSSQAQDLVCDTAIQAGPRLVVHGNVPKLKQEYSYRTALGINRNQEVLLVVSRGFISTAELAQIFAKPEAEGGLDCPNALNLDGGTSSQIYANAGGLRVSFGGFTGVPVGLGVWAP